MQEDIDLSVRPVSQLTRFKIKVRLQQELRWQEFMCDCTEKLRVIEAMERADLAKASNHLPTEAETTDEEGTVEDVMQPDATTTN